jgi:hypothetical protein
MQRQPVQVAVFQTQQFFKAHGTARARVPIEQNDPVAVVGCQKCPRDGQYRRNPTARGESHVRTGLLRGAPGSKAAVRWQDIESVPNVQLFSQVTRHFPGRMHADHDPQGQLAGGVHERVGPTILLVIDLRSDDNVLPGKTLVFGAQVRRDLQRNPDSVFRLRMDLDNPQ